MRTATAPIGLPALWVIRAGVGLVALGSAVISFDHVHRFASAQGEIGISAVLLPLVLDGATAAGAAAVLGWNRNGGRRGFAWALLVLGLAGSLAGNVASATTVAGMIGAAFPPVLLFLGVEVLSGLRRTAGRSDLAGTEVGTGTAIEAGTEVGTGTAIEAGTEVGTGTANETGTEVKAPVPAAGPVDLPRRAVPESRSADQDEVDEVTMHRARDLFWTHQNETGRRPNRDELRKMLGCSTTIAGAALRVLKSERNAA